MDEFSSLPKDYRPQPVGEEAAVDRIVLALPPPEESVLRWFDTEWSEEAILARRAKELARFPASTRKLMGPAPTTLVQCRKSLTFARLMRCFRWMVKEGLPTGAKQPVRREHGERILFIHRMLRDPDYEYRGEPYADDLSREWCLGELRDGERSAKVRAEWYSYVSWALEELDLRSPKGAAPPIDPEAQHVPGQPTKSVPAIKSDLEDRILDVLTTADGLKYLSSRVVAETMQVTHPEENADERSIRTAVKRMREAGWPIETTPRGSRIPPERRSELPGAFR